MENQEFDSIIDGILSLKPVLTKGIIQPVMLKMAMSAGTALCAWDTPQGGAFVDVRD